MKNKVFIGAWITDSTRVKLKMKCAELGINQQDVIDLLLIKWLKKKENE